MNINEHIECLQRVAARHSNDIIYFGHAAGSGSVEVYLTCKSDKF